MKRDYPSLIAALRRKARDPAVPPEEAKALNDKADKLAEKYQVVESNRTTGNGQVPTWEELLKHFTDQEHSAWAGGSQAGKSHYFSTQTNAGSGTYSYVYYTTTMYDEWLVDLDEDPKSNGSYEFPQEEGI